MLNGTRQKINDCNMTVHISGQVYSQVPFTKYLDVFIDQNLMFFKRLGEGSLFISLVASI